MLGDSSTRTGRIRGEGLTFQLGGDLRMISGDSKET
jgi:hypothetical protein